MTWTNVESSAAVSRLCGRQAAGNARAAAAAAQMTWRGATMTAQRSGRSEMRQAVMVFHLHEFPA